jgi:hypothetical protein
LESSIIDKITSDLIADGWIVRVEKSFAEVYKGKLPCICISEEDSDVKRREIGSNSYLEDILVSIRIFAENDGQRLDLAAWMLSKIMPGTNYYEYVISNGVVSSKVLKGTISVLEVTANRKELKNTDNLDVMDRYRHILSFKVRVALS